MRVRGLKQQTGLDLADDAVSHPVRVRGLKLDFDPGFQSVTLTSHPVRVRGLKRRYRKRIAGNIKIENSESE